MDTIFKEKFKSYITDIPPEILGPIILANPGHEWRIIIIKQMQKDGIEIDKQILEEIKKYDNNSLKIYYDEQYNFANAIKDEYSKFRDFHRENFSDKIPSSLDFKYFIKSKENIKANVLTDTYSDFVIMKLSILNNIK